MSEVEKVKNQEESCCHHHEEVCECHHEHHHEHKHHEEHCCCHEHEEECCTHEGHEHHHEECHCHEHHEHNHHHGEECGCHHEHHHAHKHHAEHCCCHEHEEECCTHEGHEHHHEECHCHDHHEHHHTHKELHDKDEHSKRVVFSITGLDCANCAQKLEDFVNGLPYVTQANMRFDLGRFTVDYKEDALDHIIEHIKEKEPEVQLTILNEKKYKKVYRIEGLDCAHCAQKVEDTLNKESYLEASLRFELGKLTISSEYDIMDEQIQSIIDRVEKGVHIYVEDITSPSQETSEENDHEKWVLLGSVLVFLFTMFVWKEGMIQSILFLIIYIVVGKEVISKALHNMKRGEIFDENFLMMVASIGAILIGDLDEAVAVMLFYRVGEYFQSIAVNNSRKSIKDLMKIRPDSANLLLGDSLQVVHPATLQIHDIVVVHPGERIPIDGIVVKGESMVDTSALTGESLPVNVSVESEVLSGSVNLNGELHVRVSKEFGESTASKILRLVEEAGNYKADTEKFITKFARVYTPTVCFGAVVLAILPPLLQMGEWIMWIERALTFLVISCPCAVVISIPMSYFGGIGAASKQGILIKGSQYLEEILTTKVIAMDKTGTLTQGRFMVNEVVSDYMDVEELIYVAALLENASSHPIAKAICERNTRELHVHTVEHLEEIAGKGMKALIEEDTYYVGNEKMMELAHISYPIVESEGSIVYVAKNTQYLGYISVSDTEKKNALSTVDTLTHKYHKDIVMLSGDQPKVVERVAQRLHISRYFGGLLPQNKLEIVKELQANNSHVVFVGDGINDAPVLTVANVGIAMGGIGSDAAIEASDIVFMEDDIGKLVTVFDIALFTKKIVVQNLVFVFMIKAITLVLGALGYASMWMAVFADVGVSILAILNAMRILTRKYE
ncbi:MAG: cadmium-translocating P-type ATPase [Erysipelotrichaceae bacterium]|nr:cadmium-translocating P-type ATPase [Erysipelotrichaceae bacterium]